MNAGTNLILYIVGAFVLVFVLLETKADAAFTGEIFITLFIAGLLLSLWTAIRQTEKIIKENPRPSEPAAAH